MERRLVDELHDCLIKEVGKERVSTDELTSVSSLLLPRDERAYKNRFGHALLYAGSYGMAGAAVLSARACLRSGVGLLTVCSPDCNNTILQTAVPEAMTMIPDRLTETGTIKERYNAIGAGPGLGQAFETVKTLKSLLETTERPMVLDADALNIISGEKEMLERVPKGSVLTPHPGELARLSDGPAHSVIESLRKACTLSSRYGLTIVVKGAPTVIVSPDGHFFINTTGNAGMATAGSGDVLTGIVLALLAQRYEADHAARIAVYIHGLAGDMAARELSQTAMTSADISSHLAPAWLLMEKQL